MSGPVTQRPDPKLSEFTKINITLKRWPASFLTPQHSNTFQPLFFRKEFLSVDEGLKYCEDLELL